MTDLTPAQRKANGLVFSKEALEHFLGVRPEKTCRVGNCDSKMSKSQGFCQTHYIRYLSGANLRTPATRGQRLHFLRNMPDTDECLEWPFGKGKGVYPRMRIDKKQYGVHRLVLIILTGKDFPGMEAAHGPCNNPQCVNPNHISWKTCQENQKDKIRDGTVLKGSQHPRAKLSDDNIFDIRRSQLSAKQLAEKYGVSRDSIWKIQRRISWRHI